MDPRRMTSASSAIRQVTGPMSAATEAADTVVTDAPEADLPEDTRKYRALIFNMH